MALVSTTLKFDNTNFSAQVGDIIYYTTGGGQIGGFSTANLKNTKILGKITSIAPDPSGSGSFIFTVEYDNAITSPPTSGDYISFAKDKRINTTSLVGYYADITLVNDSKEKVELFSIGSDIEESSR